MTVPQMDQLPQPPSRADPTNFPALADAFLAALAAVFPTQANAIAAFVNQMALQAAASAASAINAPGTSATSASQVTIGTGAKTFAIQTGKAFVVGQFVTVAETSVPGNWMTGQITAHDPNAGSLTVQVMALSGAGQISDWAIGLSSPMQFIAALAQDIWAGLDNTRPVTAAGLVAAAAPVPVAYASTITLDFTTGTNFTIALAGNPTLANPLNAQPGDSGIIRLVQDNTGNRAVAFGSSWLASSAVPSLVNGPNGVTLLFYYVQDATHIYLSGIPGYTA